jgi:cytochrome c oxidase subunit 4
MTDSRVKATEPAQRPKPNYIRIFIVLAVLTIIEVMASFTISIKAFLVLFLILLAASKAGLVVAYYMHLRFERAPVRVVALGPIILVVLLTAVLLVERTLAQGAMLR